MQDLPSDFGAFSQPPARIIQQFPVYQGHATGYGRIFTKISGNDICLLLNPIPASLFDCFLDFWQQVLVGDAQRASEDNTLRVENIHETGDADTQPFGRFAKSF